MPSYKLTYFNGRGRAEAMRFMFEVAGVPFEDVRIEGEKWAELKPKLNTPFGQLPILEVDGKVVAQSGALGRFLAREFGLAGSSSWETLEIDIICECCDDMVKPLVQMFGEKDEEKKKELVKKYYEETVPANLKNLEKLLCQKNEGDGFFMGDKLTAADIVFHCCAEWVATPEHPDALDSSPKVKALFGRIKAHDKIAPWLERRPKTMF